MYLRQTAQHEQLDQSRIELRRKQHAERLSRIMDERKREIGLDMPALAAQVEERRSREAAERAEDLDYQRRFLEEQRLLGRLAREEQKIRRQIELDDIHFRRDFQAPEQAREWDITRPDYKHVQPPVRAGDDDPHLSVSGGQKFEGEDLGSRDRQERQRAQLRRWQSQQIAENEHRRACELRDQREWERRYLENDRRMQEIEDEQAAARKDIQARNDAENYRSMVERQRRQANDRRDELDFNEFEKLATIESPFIAESREQAVGRFGARIVQDWKGVTDGERRQVFGDQEAQRKENAARRQQEADQEKREDAQRARETREALRRERAEMRQRTRAEIDLAREHRTKGDEHAEQEHHMNKEVYGENQPTDEFWKYFGRSHR
jgi:hypothetical protein